VTSTPDETNASKPEGPAGDELMEAPPGTVVPEREKPLLTYATKVSYPLTDWTRLVFVIGLLVILWTMVVMSFVVILIPPDRSKALVQVLGLMFGSVASLMGAAVGFYFGERSATRKEAGSS
jgi:hypothetical protein